MNWQQKAFAAQAIGRVEILLRGIEDWYIHHDGVERKEGVALSSGCVTGAKTPEEAIEQHWDWLTDRRYYIVKCCGGRSAFKWNGFMWEKVDESLRMAS